MKQSQNRTSEGLAGTLIVAGLFVAVGVIALYDTSRYSDLDSKVFPRAAAIVLIMSAILTIVVSMLRPAPEKGFGREPWWRRVLLVVSMLISCLAMPHIGFLPAGFIAFGGAMMAAMHERWSRQVFVRYVGAGVILMVGFYALFRFALNVPLP